MSSSTAIPQNIIDEFVGVCHGDFARVKTLLAQYPVLATTNASWIETPIQAAAQTGQREIVQLLLDAGAPLDICTAAMLGEHERVAAMLQGDASLAKASGAHGLPALYFAAISGRLDIAELLFAHGAPVNGGDGISPPLHGAVYFNHPPLVEWLLVHGADVNARDYQNRTALTAAVSNKRDEIARSLRQHGGIAMSSGFIKVDGCNLYYEEQGEGHPLVLLHAGIADHRMWDEQVAEFAERYRVIRWDMRGFGKSKTEAGTYSLRDDLFALLNHLEVERAYLCGVSMGGGLTIDFALEHPEMVAAFIAVAPGLSGYWPPMGDDAKAQWEKETFARGQQAWKDKDSAQYIELQMQVWVDGPLQPRERVPAAMRDKVRTMMQDEDTTEWTPKQLDPPAVNRLNEIRMPTFIIYGDLDPTETDQTCKVLGEQIPNAQTRVMRGTAHLPNMERPDEFNRIVLDFLNSLSLA